MLRRIVWLLVFLTGLGWLVAGGVGELRRLARTREMLWSVQSALQDYHVDQERYVPREKLTGMELLTVLSEFEFLDRLPPNPWSGESWKLDGVEPDHLVYETDPNFETYSLRALDPKTGKVILELDSETNRALE